LVDPSSRVAGVEAALAAAVAFLDAFFLEPPPPPPPPPKPAIRGVVGRPAQPAAGRRVVTLRVSEGMKEAGGVDKRKQGRGTERKEEPMVAGG